jgi:hypothetical protein
LSFGGCAACGSSPGLSRAQRGKGQCPERRIRAFLPGDRRRTVWISAQRTAPSPLLTVQAAHRILCALGSRVPMLQGQAHPHTAGAGLVRALAARPHIGDAIRVFGTMTLNQQEMARFA